MDDFDKLVQQVASYLGGQAVQIRWQNPVGEHAAAQVYRTPEGKVVVDIGRFVSITTTYQVLLHELAHVHLGHAQLATPGDDYKQRSQSVKQTPEQRDAWRASEPEADANKLASEWFEYARVHAWQFVRFDEPGIAAHLRALLTWQDKK